MTTPATTHTEAGETVQRDLRATVADRLRRARPDLADRHDLTTYDGLAAAGAEIAAETDTETEQGDGTLVAVVVRDLDLTAWARQTCAYALGLEPGPAQAWRRSLTRTVFVAGNPAHLAARFPPARTAPDGSAAWTAPGPPMASAPLRRLLKLLQANAPVPTGPDTSFDVPAPPDHPRPTDAPASSGRVHHLHLATADCTYSAALVHLNHVLVEAVLDGLLRPGDHVVLRRVPHLGGPPAPFSAVRAVPDPHRPGHLRTAAALTGPLPTGAD
ncbi:DUF6182 family protein [Streptomyces sp. NPDC058417]|uniref:DUF6182 family protein n=1 Tax=unclassified Streptomyces TaxID=2593676 RepID=UPI0036547F69